jgi:hypothetical protein
MAFINVQQGVINRALTAISVVLYPELNITAGYFTDKAARISFEGTASDYLPTLTGAVASPRFVQFVTITAYINIAQGLAAQWENVRQTNALLGDVNFVTPSSALGDYYLYNCVLENIAEVDGSGGSADFVLTIRGSMPINGALM